MPAKKRLLIFFGMIATGKSHLASAFAKRSGCAYYNSDIIRKELAGLSSRKRELAAIDTGIYTSDFSRRTYDTLLDRARCDLDQGRSPCVILDGSYQRRDERDRLRQAFGSEYQLIFVFCQCPETVMKQRMDRRLQNPHAVSDGRWEIYLEQKQRFEMPIEIPKEQLLVVDTDRPLADLLSVLQQDLGWPEK
jgi:predicted kinase